MLVIASLVIGLLLGGLALWFVMRERIAATRRSHSDGANEFQALATEVLRQSKTDFLELAKTQLEGLQAKAGAEFDQRHKAVEQLVAPIRESLDKVDVKIQELEKARNEAYGSLISQVRGLAEAQKELRAETGNLVTALRSPVVRGRWGEMQLRRVVEAAGMIQYCDFSEQTTLGSDGRISRPDLIVHLAGGKNVVVDAKTPLQAYLEALEAKDETTRNARLDDHARQLRDHVLKLSAKGYWSQLESTPEFVVLFIPGETFFSAALERDPSLIEESMKRQVILATPTTLIAVLWAIAHGWREERLAENARAISELGRELHGRLSTLAGHFGKLKRSIESVVRSYNDAAGSLETRVLVSARRLKDLGATATGEIELLEPVEQAPRPLSAAELVEPVDAADLRRKLDAA
jgi:DNA recombination protein RmuC